MDLDLDLLLGGGKVVLTGANRETNAVVSPEWLALTAGLRALVEHTFLPHPLCKLLFSYEHLIGQQVFEERLEHC